VTRSGGGLWRRGFYHAGGPFRDRFFKSGDAPILIKSYICDFEFPRLTDRLLVDANSRGLPGDREWS
jgi:hypothetical protein